MSAGVAEGSRDTSAVAGEERPAGSGAVRRRTRRANGDARGQRVNLRLHEGEFEVLAEAAGRAGLTPSGFAAAAALAAASGATAVAGGPSREALLELMAARGVLGRIGGLLNQLAAASNSGGEVPAEQLQAVLLRVVRAAERVESAASVTAARVP